MEKKIKSAEYVRENDSNFTAFCLYMLQVIGKPRFSLVGMLGWTFAIFAAVLGIALLIDSVIPFGIALGIAVLLAIPAIIGACIRDKRLRQE